MNSDIVVSAQGLGKKYEIGKRREVLGSHTYRDLVTDTVKGAVRRLANRNPIAKDEESKRTETFWALQDVNFEIKRGSAVGIIGPNGAGKSTLLKILSRITEPTTGRVLIAGRVASLLEVGTGFHSELTGRENIYLNGAILNMSRQEIKRRFDEIVEFADIEQFLDTPVKRYSSGMYVRLAFAIAAHLDPEILIVDEVLAVGDMRFRAKCLRRMEAVAGMGRTVIFVTHDMAMIRMLCTDAILLESGKVAMSGGVDEVSLAYERSAWGMEDVESGVRVRGGNLRGFHFSRVELRDPETQQPKYEFEAGERLAIHLWSDREAPSDGYTVEYELFNERGAKISFGAANPVRDVYFGREHNHYICTLGPLPLTAGLYHFSFLIRMWHQERWDKWEQAIRFRVAKCDPYETGYNIVSATNGDFIMLQEWRGEAE